MPRPEVVQRHVSPAEFRSRLAADACVMEPGELVDARGLEAEELSACQYRSESGFYFEITDAQPENAAMSKSKKQKPESVETPTVEVIADDAAPMPALAAPAIPFWTSDGGVITPVIASVPALPADLKNAIPPASEISGLSVIMAVVAVAGGGAAWKFYNEHSRRKHEQEMARIERGNNDDTHKKCDASRAALELRVTDVQARVEAVYARMDATQRELAEIKDAPPKLAFDADDLEARLAKLEKLIKKGRK